MRGRFILPRIHFQLLKVGQPDAMAPCRLATAKPGLKSSTAWVHSTLIPNQATRRRPTRRGPN